MIRKHADDIGMTRHSSRRGAVLPRGSNRRLICGALLGVGFATGVGASDKPPEWAGTPCALHPRAGYAGLPQITATVQVPSVQPDPAAGIQVLVDVANTGSDEVELFELVENLFIDVRNAAGQVVGLPWIPPSLRGHRAPATDPALRERLRQADEDERHFQTRELASSERDPAIRAKSLHDLQNGNVVLGPSEHFQFVAVVTTALADPEAYDRAQRGESVRGDDGMVTVTWPVFPRGRFVPERASIERSDPTGATVVICAVQAVPPGVYRLQVELMLTTRGPGGGHSIRQSDPITVQLGRE